MNKLIKIVPLEVADENSIQQAALLLQKSFSELGSGSWSSPEAALAEVMESLEEGRISLVALDVGKQVVGWIAAISAYGGHVFELHPLAVAQSRRKQGIGRALVCALEDEGRRRGAVTLMLGTDDEYGQTNLSGVALYPDVWRHISAIQNLKGHPYEFYSKLGFAIVGVIPDANGPGKPDIIMAKRLKS